MELITVQIPWHHVVECGRLAAALDTQAGQLTCQLPYLTVTITTAKCKKRKLQAISH